MVKWRNSELVASELIQLQTELVRCRKNLRELDQLISESPEIIQAKMEIQKAKENLDKIESEVKIRLGYKEVDMALRQARWDLTVFSSKEIKK